MFPLDNFFVQFYETNDDDNDAIYTMVKKYNETV